MNKSKVLQLLTHISVTIGRLGDAIIEEDYIDIEEEKKK